jgi:hypothetical protein
MMCGVLQHVLLRHAAACQAAEFRCIHPTATAVTMQRIGSFNLYLE